MSLALFSIPVFIILSTKFITVTPSESSISAPAFPSKDFNNCIMSLSKVIYVSIIKPLFKNNNFILSILLLFTVFAKHTFIFPPSISKGTTLFFLAISRDIYSEISIFNIFLFNNIPFSPRISPIDVIKIYGSQASNSYKQSPIFVFGWLF